MNSDLLAESFAAYPLVDLDDPSTPRDGLLIQCNSTCKKYFTSRPACVEHYRRMRQLEAGRFVQCPFGFSSAVAEIGQRRVALTSFIPYPRHGGSSERAVAKRHPESKIEKARVASAIDAMQLVERTLREEKGRLLTIAQEREAEIIQRYAMALHEVRKLNRTVKILAERRCIEEKPDDPVSADPSMVKIWKASEMMSREFDVIEVLANEALTEIPLNTVSEPYKLFDKCVRIYRPEDDPDRIVISAPPNYDAKIRACDKTLPIIPTVLLDNARRYSAPKTPIEVRVEPDERRECVVTVSNFATEEKVLDNTVFERGVRGETDTDGSGNGLYVAQLVAGQHGTRITVHNSPPTRGLRRHTFRIAFRTIE